ncbi:GntR family transcriptional regulator [Acaricomes phytoseiuli]|uniref:GntR family transcriptional regulator n=1 Tax=Acaricomes phytoseiuli TaxID=291968 RepID=UPI0003719296|nr:GntR family transcriptional regulator [Acaricomes phytoseiuli]
MRASEKAYQRIRQEIVSWQLAPGSLLGEVELSARLGVSRTPVREALSRLVAEGLAAPRGGRGIVVSELSPSTLNSLYELRQTLESAAAGLAAERGETETFTQLAQRFTQARTSLQAGIKAEAYYELSAELDTALDQQCGNPFLATALRQLRPQLARARRMSREHRTRLAETATEHARICTAIASRDVRLAQAATTVHLHNSLKHLMQTIETVEESV